MKEKKGKNFRQALTMALDIPQSSLPGEAHIELISNSQAIIEGCRGVLEYDDDKICFKFDKLSVRLRGRNLGMTSLNEQSAVVNGFILGVEYII